MGTVNVRARFLVMLVAGLPGLSFAGSDDGLNEIVIEINAPAEPLTAGQNLSLEGLNLNSAADMGEALNNVQGLESGRKGGRGFEPIIRGQQQSRISILTDGTRAAGACPSRMDPPAGQFSPAGYDRVTVLQGISTLQYGASPSGGIVLFERDRRHFSDSGTSGRISTAYKSNRDSWHSEADCRFESLTGQLRLYAETTDQGNYHDGNGNMVSAAWKGSSGGLLFALPLAGGSRLELNIETVNDKNLLYAGNGMDAPYGDSESWRLMWQGTAGCFDSVEVNFWQTAVRHLMDDYTLRDRKPGSRYGVRAPSTATTTGFRATGLFNHDAAVITCGVDWLRTEQDASRWKVDKQGVINNRLVSMLWPDIEIQQAGLFSELDYDIDARNSFKAGLRYDYVETRARNAVKPELKRANPQRLYNQYSGSGRLSRHDNNISLLLGWSCELSSQDTLSVQTARTRRSPDATESYIASFGGCCSGSGSWVGNPGLKPETHQQYSMELLHQQQKLEWLGTIWCDDVSNYIERYQHQGVTRYQNTRARLWGADLGGRFAYSDSWNYRAGCSWVKGRDTSNHHDLAQIPPLTLTLGADYLYQGLRCSVDWWLARRQTKIDKTSGLDASETPGYGVVNFSSEYKVTPSLALQAGLENLFDKTWARHISSISRDPFSPDAVRVNEPGRRLWLKAICYW
ncbi:TonB-dependent receptor domain-containing protein [Spongorhabdus nitratireducens]